MRPQLLIKNDTPELSSSNGVSSPARRVSDKVVAAYTQEPSFCVADEL